MIHDDDASGGGYEVWPSVTPGLWVGKDATYGVMAQGATACEARKNVHEAVRLFLKVRAANRRKLAGGG